MRHFELAEFDCSETGENKMTSEFLTAIDELRETCDFPFSITSGYRSPVHSIEAAKKVPGRHTEGIAADIQVSDGVQRAKIAYEAAKQGFAGIGVAKTFVHVDLREGQYVLWTYD